MHTRKNHSLVLQIILYTLLLIAVDNVFLQGLESPEMLFKWLSEVFKDPNLFAEELQELSDRASGPFLSPESFLWLLPTILLWIFKKRRFLLIPIILYNAWITFWTVVAIVLLSINLWNPRSGAEVLLSDALLVWVSSLLIFTVWYWIVDIINPKQDFLFPQAAGSFKGWEGWKPGFVDYLFLSFNTSTAFGSSDTIILTKKAKLLVILQSILSLVLFAVIAARAINIIR